MTMELKCPHDKLGILKAKSPPELFLAITESFSKHKVLNSIRYTYYFKRIVYSCMHDLNCSAIENYELFFQIKRGLMVEGL